MRFFASGFFHESVSPKPRTIPLGPFNIFRKFVEIFSAQGLPPVSLTPMAICHRRHWHQWRIWSLLLTQMSPLAGKPFQAIATMAYTRWHTRPSQKDLGCMGAPSFLHAYSRWYKIVTGSGCGAELEPRSSSGPKTSGLMARGWGYLCFRFHKKWFEFSI
jgi:hypothetical protein